MSKLLSLLKSTFSIVQHSNVDDLVKDEDAGLAASMSFVRRGFLTGFCCALKEINQSLYLMVGIETLLSV